MENALFLLSKTLWLAVQPDNLLVLLLLAGVVGLWLGRRGARTLLSLLAVPACALMLFPLGDLLLQPLETRFDRPALPKQVAGILVLGGAEDAQLSDRWQQPQFNMAAERLMLLPELMQRYPDSPVLVTGGSASVLNPQYRGADVARDWLESLPPLANPVLFERDARNTWENARQSARLLGGVPSEPWLLVTSAYHMPRSVGIYRQLGWQVIPYPVDYYGSGLRYRPQFAGNLRDLVTAVKEWSGLLIYHLLGRTDRLFPGPES
ncbi:YdcF family protein [Marinobacterium aestuariivivens]|uniref:YdcF family protein n=1 Tax=Marinobacterium aestuariivivens TaxID=1698799 RepID=A0ABW1ZY65_9GAMM